MKKAIILSLMALFCTAMQADEPTTWYKAKVMPKRNFGCFMMSCPPVTVDSKTKKKTVNWFDTENNSWHENIGVVKNVPTVDSLKDILPANMAVSPNHSPLPYVPMAWQLTDENDETVLHCYLRMPAEVVNNLWLASDECVILDKTTGTIYQSRRTVPAECYGKVFSVKAKEGTFLDFQIVFPKLAEGTTNIVIYGVPSWSMRGLEVSLSDEIPVFANTVKYDNKPQFHTAHLVSEAKNYNKDDFKTWAVYDDPHLIKPVPDGTLALWVTPEATYLAEACEMNWKREYFGRGGDDVLIDRNGHQYKQKKVIDYPNKDIFWMEGSAGDYFAIVQVFEPLPPMIESVTYVVPEGEPFSAWGANWDGKVIELDVKQLRNNQKLFEYNPRNIVK